MTSFKQSTGSAWEAFVDCYVSTGSTWGNTPEPPAATVNVRSSRSATHASGGNLAVDLGAPVAGDLAVLSVFVRSGSTFTPPSGWATHSQISMSSGHTHYLLTKTLVGGETGPTLTQTGGALSWGYGVVVLSGVAASSPLTEGETKTAIASSSTLGYLTVTDTPNALLLMFATQGANGNRQAEDPEAKTTQLVASSTNGGHSVFMQQVDHVGPVNTRKVQWKKTTDGTVVSVEHSVIMLCAYPQA